MNKRRVFIVTGLLCAMVGIMAFTLNKDNYPKVARASALPAIKKDSVASVTAFKQVYTVLMSARCM
ncbi:hypothetical protein [Mucilaginibacter pankratovii]|uniref:hypothetical protein n=1 Tax=Mucilaginibacter pankratovii TaxID=2772110 RepID=UPI001CD1799F|nr:hypothetical protein [Mucilaginibacter pankratovii]